MTIIINHYRVQSNTVMNNITGALYRVSSNSKTKRNEVLLGKDSVTSSSVQKVVSSGSSGKTD